MWARASLFFSPAEATWFHVNPTYNALSVVSSQGISLNNEFVVLVLTVLLPYNSLKGAKRCKERVTLFAVAAIQNRSTTCSFSFHIFVGFETYNVAEGLLSGARLGLERHRVRKRLETIIYCI
jgi:hypothetical protein